MTRKPKTTKREITLIIYENFSFYIKTVIFTIKLFVLSLRVNMAMSCPNMGDTPFLIKTRMNCFRYLKLMSPLNAAICTTISKDKNVMARARKYYLKNNYLTLRSKIKVPRRSLRYMTHCLMVMHTHTK